MLLTRLRIGHTRLTHGYLMSTPHEAAPRCNNCNSILTIRHILVECRNFNSQRALYFGNKTLEEILRDSEHFNISQILRFLRSTGLINKI